MKKFLSFLCGCVLISGCFFATPSIASSSGPLWADHLISPQNTTKKTSGKHKRPKKMYLTVFHYEGGEVDLGKEEKKRLMRTVQRLDKGSIKSVRFVCAAEGKQTCKQRIKKMRIFILNNIMGDHFRYTVKIIHPDNNANKSNLLKVIEK